MFGFACYYFNNSFMSYTGSFGVNTMRISVLYIHLTFETITQYCDINVKFYTLFYIRAPTWRRPLATLQLRVEDF